ncbi:MAG: hypothetical protein EB127_27225, partial [Alphaproteobacteria bacterium]|nr:hypothetical protein [Alphaproteobacteria bacterium]
EITISSLIKVASIFVPTLNESQISKIQASKTTEVFLNILRKTRHKMNFFLDSSAQFEPTIQKGHVQGHPDILTQTRIFEIKLTGQLQKHWQDFLLQVYSYLSLHPSVKSIHLVLPLQCRIWSASADEWILTSPKFLQILESNSIRLQTKVAEQNKSALDILNRFAIGSHTSKSRTILSSISTLDTTKPWQIFLGSAMSTKVNIKSEDLNASKQFISEHGLKVFAHTPYLLNLAIEPASLDNYVVTSTRQQLTLANQMGFKGVVIHVGKYTTQDPVVARKNMISNVLSCLDSATPSCPLLLETPAGQGSEMLITWEDFMGFVTEINDERLRICIDTCHVFAAGHCPVKYIEQTLQKYPRFLKLVHYNDSMDVCGSCKDRHALVGSGHIGSVKMEKIAEILMEAGIPAVVE